MREMNHRCKVKITCEVINFIPSLSLSLQNIHKQLLYFLKQLQIETIETKLKIDSNKKKMHGVP